MHLRWWAPPNTLTFSTFSRYLLFLLSSLVVLYFSVSFFFFFVATSTPLIVFGHVFAHVISCLSPYWKLYWELWWRRCNSTKVCQLLVDFYQHWQCLCVVISLRPCKNLLQSTPFAGCCFCCCLLSTLCCYLRSFFTTCCLMMWL